MLQFSLNSALPAPKHVALARDLAASLVAALPIFMSGCASTKPPLDISQSAEQMTRAFPARLAFADSLDSQYGLSGLRLRLDRFIRRCELDGGKSETSGYVVTRFVTADGSFRQVSLPKTFACRTGSDFAWSLLLSYGNPTFLVGIFSGDATYLTTVAIEYQSGEVLTTRRRESEAQNEAARQRASGCAAKRVAYAERLHKDPRVGMEVGFGMIIEVRPPLALVQYGELGRRINGKDQEWVAVSSLGPGSDCPP